MDAVDTWIKTPDRAADKPFLMPIEDVFTISGRGTVVTGRVERGTVKVGDKVEIVGIKDTQETTVTGTEMFHKTLEFARLVTTSAACSAASTRRALSVARSSLLRSPSTRTPSSRARFTSCPRKRAAVTPRSSTTTVPSSTSVPPT